MLKQGTLVDVTDIAQNLPIIPSPIIARDNLLDTIETGFNQGFESIVVEAEESLGKTTLLYLAAKQYLSNCCYVYIRGTSVYSYHPAAVRSDICNQLCWVMNGTRHPDSVPTDDSAVRQYIFDLTRRLARARKHFYFIVDGLDELPDSAPQISEILNLLPFGNTWFRFLLSGKLSKFKRLLPAKLKVKDFPISPFSFPETRDFLSDLPLDEPTIRDFHISSGGKPGHLSTIRRLLTSGTSVEQLLDHKAIKDLFELEWGKALEASTDSLEIVRFIALARHKLSIDDLAYLTNLSDIDIRKSIASTTFLAVDTQSDEVTIVSQALGRFLQTKMKADEALTLRRLTDYLLRSPESSKARELLPEYLSATNQKDALIAYLGHDYFLAGIRDAESLMHLKRQAALGAELSDELRSPDALRCTLLVNIVSSLFSITAAKEELIASIALGDYEQAATIANSASLPEDRLLLLAALARARQQKGLEPEDALKDSLLELVKRISTQKIDQEKAVTIASELFPVLPDQALQILKAGSAGSGSDTSVDWALAEMSVNTLMGLPRASVNTTADLFRERIEDKHARSTISMLSMFLAPRSATEVLKQAAEITDPSDQLLVLRLWCKAHPKTIDAISVSEYAMDLALRSTATTVNAATYCAIATPLLYCTDIDRIRTLVTSFESQRAVFEKLGPIEEVLRLELRLSEAESHYDVDAAIQRLLTIYAQLESRLPDWASRATFYAELTNLVERLIPRSSNQDLLDIRDATKKELDQALNALLRDSAKHADILRDVIEILADRFPDRAIAISQRLNTQDRRDLSIKRAIERILRTEVNADRVKVVLEGIPLIDDLRSRDAASMTLVETLSRGKHFDSWKSETARIVQIVHTIKGAGRRTRAIGRLLRSLPQDEAKLATDLEPERLFEKLIESWNQIDQPWLKVRIGFEISSFLAIRFPDSARNLQKTTRNYRQVLPFQSERSSTIYIHLVDLSIRAYRGLIEAQLDTEKDFEELSNVIESISSFGDRAFQWSGLALALFATGRSDQARSVVFRNLKPCIDAIAPDNSLHRYDKLILVAPSLWLANRQTAEDLFNSLPTGYRDDMYDVVARYLLTKVDPGDPYSWKGTPTASLDFNTGMEIFDLICKISNDGSSYGLLDVLLERVYLSRKRAVWSRDQIEALANRIERIYLPTFPRPKEIQHNGYKILVAAWLAKLRQSKGSWEQLGAEAKQIPNAADVVYVLSNLADLVPPQSRALRREFLTDAQALVSRIPSTTDQIDRYAMLATSAKDFDPLLAKKITAGAFRLSTSKDDLTETKVAEEQQETLLTMAYSMDKEFANSLANLLNDDPAKMGSRGRAHALIARSEIEANLLNEKAANFDLPSGRDTYALPSSAWQCLGEMNSGRALPVHAPRINALIATSARFDLVTSYPILALIVENQRRMYAGTAQGKQYLRGTFDVLIRSAIFAEHAVHVISQNPFRRINIRDTDGSNLVLKDGDVDKAKSFISDWIALNVADEYLVCDPYFSPDDLSLLLIFSSKAPAAMVNILTGEEGLNQNKILKPYDESYRRAWRAEVSDTQDPPDSKVTIVGTDPDGKSPFHDRWILCEKGGIRMGTSYNSLGKKLSELSIVSQDEALTIFGQLEPFVTQKQRRYLGEKLRYNSFSL